MCISVLAPKQSISIIYASETVWFVNRRGLFEVVADLLILNDSPDPIERLFCIVPQQTYLREGEIPIPPTVEDITEDLADENSRYSSQEVAYKASIEDNRTIVTLTLPNPTDTTEDIQYKGLFVGGNEIFDVAETDRQRVLLNLRMLGVSGIKFGSSIQPKQARWLRLRILPLTGPQEQRGWWALVTGYLLNTLTFSYNVSGPAKVRYDVAKNLANLKREAADARSRGPAGQRTGDVLTSLERLWDILVEGATEHPLTKVGFEDWRTRFFESRMEPFASIQTEGNVRTVGAQPNAVDRRRPEPYYEWASGRLQVAQPQEGVSQAYFSIRFTTRFVGVIHRLATVVGFLALIVSLIGIVLAVIQLLR